jgi:hypothetical protein
MRICYIILLISVTLAQFIVVQNFYINLHRVFKYGFVEQKLVLRCAALGVTKFITISAMNMVSLLYCLSLS